MLIRLLREASAIGRFPTPIDDLMAAAKLTVVDDEVLNEGFLRAVHQESQGDRRHRQISVEQGAGLFEANDRFVLIDKNAPKPRVPFIKLHEAGHGTMPHQSKLYKIMHDCKKTLEPDIADLFEREANVFASEVLFQGDAFSQEAHAQSFGIKVPIKLAKKFGGSNYATFRRYVITNPNACCVVILEPVLDTADGSLSAEVRRVVMSKSFEKIFDGKVLTATVTDAHPSGPWSRPTESA